MGLYTIPLPVSSRQEAKAKEGEPRKEIIYDGYYYDVSDFINRHPGGVELLDYYTNPGEDATIAVTQFHNRSKGKVDEMMKSMKRRPVENVEQSERNKAMTEDFLKLFEELKREGYFEPNYYFLTWRIVEMILILSCGYTAYFKLPSLIGQALAIFLIGLAHGRVGYIIHELGHYGSTGDKVIDTFLGKILIGVGWGMSFTWWGLYHSPHHAMPQRLHRDRALEPFEFMISNVKSVEDEPLPVRKAIIKNQVYHLFLDTFAGLFILQGQSAQVIWEMKNYFEGACVLLHLYLASYLGIWPFLLSRFFWSVYTFGQVALSHSHLPVAEGPAHWAEYALMYTVNIDGSAFWTWWTGYLNFQIEHHMFPTMPDCQLPKVQGRVKEFAEKHGLPYQVLSYPEAVVKTVTSFWDVSVQLHKLFSKEE